MAENSQLGSRWRAVVSFLENNLVKFGINTTSDILATTKILGAGALLESRELGGYMDTNVIPGYRFNENDGKWYQTSPDPDHGTFGWFYPAPPALQSELTNMRYWRDQHNRVERTRPEDGGTGYNSPSIIDLGKNLPKIVDRYREISPDIWRDLKDYLGFPSSVVNENWRQAFNPPRRDPLAIDLDNDGIETSGIPSTGRPIAWLYAVLCGKPGSHVTAAGANG